MFPIIVTKLLLSVLMPSSCRAEALDATNEPTSDPDTLKQRLKAVEEGLQACEIQGCVSDQGCSKTNLRAPGPRCTPMLCLNCAYLPCLLPAADKRHSSLYVPVRPKSTGR